MYSNSTDERSVASAGRNDRTGNRQPVQSVRHRAHDHIVGGHHPLGALRRIGHLVLHEAKEATHTASVGSQHVHILLVLLDEAQSLH